MLPRCRVDRTLVKSGWTTALRSIPADGVIVVMQQYLFRSKKVRCNLGVELYRGVVALPITAMCAAVWDAV